jgi:hypothetical protein
MDSMVLNHVWANSSWIFLTAWRKTRVGRILFTSGSLRSLRLDRALFYYFSYSSVLVALADLRINLYRAKIFYSRA